jgi:K+-transporting ATPase ATPase C chain
MILVMTVVLGVAYPALIGLFGLWPFSAQANGSLVVDSSGRVRGSALLAQAEGRSGRFVPRPSAAAWAGDAGTASNLGPTSASLAATAAERREKLVASANGSGNPSAAVPAELVYASGSGLDPDLSPSGARFQVPRIAAELGVAEAEINAIVDAAIVRPTFGFIGSERVNVLRLNLELERRYHQEGALK